MPAKKKGGYEQQMAELESIVEQLESGELSLEDAMKAYEKGVAVAKTLETLLGDARRKVEILTKEGEEPFEAEVEA